MSETKKPKILAHLGIVPFMFALGIACFGYFDLQTVFDFDIRYTRFKSYMIAHTYGAVIVAFLGGIQWGLSLNEQTDRQYFFISNVLALLAWASLFAFASFVGIFTILMAFIFALIVDSHAYKNGVISEWFWQLRLRISVIVMLTLSLLLFINK